MSDQQPAGQAGRKRKPKQVEEQLVLLEVLIPQSLAKDLMGIYASTEGVTTHQVIVDTLRAGLECSGHD